jgi:hypothetical protein
MMNSSTTGQSSRRVPVFACLFLLGANAILADTLWTRTYGSPWKGDDAACTALTDTFNNTTIVGTGGHYPGIAGSNMVVIKYSWQNGRTMWTKRISADDKSVDIAMDAAIRPEGSVCVTGQTGQSPNYDIMTVQLDPNGNEVWRATYDGIKHAPDLGMAIATDTSANVFVAGSAQNTTMDIVTMKYYWDGRRAWARTYDGGGDDKPTGMALGPDGSVYVMGISWDGISRHDYLTVKYSSGGTQEWVAAYNGPNNGPDDALALAVDGSGNAYVTGSSRTGYAPGNVSYVATVKYDSAGTEQWVARYLRPGSWGVALALGPTALYVAGKTSGDLDDDDYVTIAYDYGTGDTLWARRDNGEGNSNDAAVGIAVGSDSSIWVTGSSNNHFMTVLYTSDGVEHWVERYGSSDDDVAVAIAVNKANQVVVTGNTWASPGYDILTVKFDTIGLAVAEPRGLKPLSDFRLEAAPNPSASGLVTLRFDPGSTGLVDVTVSGVDGRVVLTRSIETSGTNGIYPLDLGKLDAGVYIVRLESGRRAATQKLVIGQ